MSRNTTPTNRAAEFDVADLFFSTTDRKGIITSCNEVFLRIADFPPEEILGAPHNLIRHPDMPRAVFHLLWQYLLSGRAIGAYVKNMTRTGDFYWVFALALPIEDGFLSIRLKPTTGTLDAVRGLYRNMLEKERASGRDVKAGMEASTQLLTETLGTLGFQSYDQFMVTSLRAEIAARREAMRSRKDREIRSEGVVVARRMHKVFDELKCLDDLGAAAGGQAKSLSGVSRTIQRAALNANICATRMQEHGRALAVLSEQASDISTDIHNEGRELASAQQGLESALGATSLQISFATLVAEMAATFEQQIRDCQLDPEQQRATYGATCEELSASLSRALKGTTAAAADGVKGLRGALRSFRNIADQLSKILLTTRINHVTGRSTAASLPGGELFCDLLDEMMEAADSARETLDNLKEATARVDRTVSGWALRSAGA